MYKVKRKRKKLFPSLDVPYHLMIYCATAVNMGQFPSVCYPELHVTFQPGPL